MMTYKSSRNFYACLGSFLNSTKRFTARMDSYSSTDKRDHSIITADQYRQNIISKAEVIDLKRESSTVKSLSLKIDHPEFTFKAGQWVDFFIPNVEQVGGFSICSSPQKLLHQKILNLAVKYSEYPPAHWIHTQCQIGSKVEVRSGGEFFYDSEVQSLPHNLLLIGGGVGINPLASIYRYCAELYKNDSRKKYLPGKVLLMFSAFNSTDLLFKDCFQSISQNIPSFHCQFYVTNCNNTDQEKFERTRINKEHLIEALQDLGRENTICYICGPLSMITDMESILKDLGIKEKNIKYEKWW